jgi:hypothetical protein
MGLQPVILNLLFKLRVICIYLEPEVINTALDRVYAAPPKLYGLEIKIQIYSYIITHTD